MKKAITIIGIILVLFIFPLLLGDYLDRFMPYYAKGGAHVLLFFGAAIVLGFAFKIKNQKETE